MDNIEPCSICGCTQNNLIDGFYYCAECGTQDTNVRETLVDFTTVGDGILALGVRKRITQIPKAKDEEMTDDWYKWHSMNFLLKGLADELIELGAAPTFKTKLLWVWTRYMKKFQNKADFGLAVNDDENIENEEEEEEKLTNDNLYGSDEEGEERIAKPKAKYDHPDIKKISMNLVIAMLYVALNLDKSHIQLAQLIRLMREGRLSIMEWRKLIPKELRPGKLRKCLLLNAFVFRYSYKKLRMFALQLFRDLDLGNPVVPDLRPLVDLYMQELCLPNDLKPLVLSLMYYRSFDYLDVDVRHKDILHIPSYELHVMSHILMAIKICFGLDCEYEVRMSDAVEKINEIEDHPKSYNSEPTERLFSFREWHNHIQFRKTLLKTHTLYLGMPNYFDMDDYVAFEHRNEKPDFKVIRNDEIAMDIIKKIPANELNVIPKAEFYSTMTPHTSYTQVILKHSQDPDVKRLLSEDFTQYSLKYFINDMFLVDPDSANPQNILTGVSELNKIEYHKDLYLIDTKKTFSKTMVYVKDCDNHNWTVTQRPQLEHITKTKSREKADEKDNDHGYESNSETSSNILNSKTINLDNTQESIGAHKETSANVCNDSKAQKNFDITDNEMDIDGKEESDDVITLHDNKMIVDSENVCDINIDLTIQEEDENKCIFDDDFLFLDAKIKEENNDEPEMFDIEVPCDTTESFNIPDVLKYDGLTQDYRTGGKDSDVSSDDSVLLNPETLNRTEAIKELVIHACNKYKVSLPGKYIHLVRRKVFIRKKNSPRVNMPKFKGETPMKINGLIAAYHSHVENDIFRQMSNMVQSAIADFNETKGSEKAIESEDPPLPDEMDVTFDDQDIQNEPNKTQEAGQSETIVEEDQYNLFSDNSDGETNAEELLPKKNPQFDEETHDIKQLYIQPAETPCETEIKLNPKLFTVIDAQIGGDKNSKLDSAPDLNTEKEQSDSEEDISLSVLQEFKLQRRQLSEQIDRHKGHPRLIRSKVPFYRYWLRHYHSDIISVRYILNQRFATDLDAKLPKSFVFVLKECADVCGYPPFNLYKGLQRCEKILKDKYVKGKKMSMSYLEKTKKGISRRDF